MKIHDFDAKLDTNLAFDSFSPSKSHQNIIRQIYEFKIFALKNWKWKYLYDSLNFLLLLKHGTREGFFFIFLKELVLVWLLYNTSDLD